MVGSAVAQGSRDQHTATNIVLTSNLQVPPAALGPSLEMTLKPKAQSPEPLTVFADMARGSSQVPKLGGARGSLILAAILQAMWHHPI